MVKVLSWKEGPRENQQFVNAEKISTKEWNAYCKETLRINANTLKSKTMKKLEEIEELIKKHNGFTD